MPNARGRSVHIDTTVPRRYPDDRALWDERARRSPAFQISELPIRTSSVANAPAVADGYAARNARRRGRRLYGKARLAIGAVGNLALAQFFGLSAEQKQCENGEHKILQY